VQTGGLDPVTGAVIWLPYMAAQQKTTVYLDPDAYRRLKLLARRRRVAPAALVREAVNEYAERHAPRQTRRSVGAGASRSTDLGSRAEALLAGGFGES
jgi:Ribbon-helix-helix domain